MMSLRPLNFWLLPLLVFGLSMLPAEANATEPRPAVESADEPAVAPSAQRDEVRRVAPVRNEPRRSTRHPGPRAVPMPWLLFAAMGCALFVTGPLLGRLRRRRNLVTAAGLVLLGVGTFVFRRWAFPEAFFHQNGHGAMWIDCALSSSSDVRSSCNYGDGFRDLFGLAVRWDLTQPEHGLFVAHGILGALAVVAAWSLARSVGAPRVIAWAIALSLAIEPGLGRLTQSESYFGVVAWLLLFAAALLASGARSGKVISSRFIASVMGAGLLISQAALVHPIAWVPGAFIPLAAWAGPGALRRRTRLLVAATVGIGLVALVAVGPEMLQVFIEHSRFSNDLSFGVARNSSIVTRAGLAFTAVVVALTLLSRQRRARPYARPALRWTLRFGALLLAIGVSDTLHILLGLTPWLVRAWWVPYLPAFIAAGASLTWPLHRPLLARTAGALVLAGGVAFTLCGWAAQTLLPTDALESRLTTIWRQTLPPNSGVVHLERLNSQISVLAVYPETGVTVFPIRLLDGQAELDLTFPMATHYHRSSVCSTPRGEPFCDALESKWELEPVAVTDLPAIASFPQLPYSKDPVRVGLYRINRRDSASAGP